MDNALSIGSPRRRRALAVGATMMALASAAVLAAPADAVPVRNLRVSVGYPQVSFSATIVSPANAKNCTANVQAAVMAPNPLRRLKALGNHKINVCQNGNRGVTTGRVKGYFGMGNIRAGRYALCLRAVQNLRNGRKSAHTECKLFYWYGG
jgi:hypothetical protein